MQRKDNDGVLFKNEDKQTDTQPDYKGSAMVDGHDYWLSSWVNESKSGKKYMSLKLSPKEVHNHGAQQAVAQTPSGRTKQYDPAPQAEFDEDLPF
jgi:uncharacterized protein (DUF736 family)